MKVKVCKCNKKIGSFNCTCLSDKEIKVISIGDYTTITGKPNNKKDFTKLILEHTKSF